MVFKSMIFGLGYKFALIRNHGVQATLKVLTISVSTLLKVLEPTRMELLKRNIIESHHLSLKCIDCNVENYF